MEFVSDIMADEKKEQCTRFLEALVTESDAIDTGLLASPDGLLLAGTGLDSDLDVMAAMSASLISLADALSSRSEDGRCDKVLSESDDGTLVVLHAGDVILTVLGKAGANMGMVLSSSRMAAEKIASTLQG